MSQRYEDYPPLFYIRCRDVGLDCNCTIYGIEEETTTYNTILHLFEDHAIAPEEMTTCMKLKIIENMRIHHQSPLPTSPSSYNTYFGGY
jgi:predicted small metal-binding protein